MELAIEILNKEIERREILLAVENNVLIQNDMHNEIGGLKDVVKNLTIPLVSKCYTEKDMDDAYDKGFNYGNQRDLTGSLIEVL